jgi:hypothetical protein
VLCPYPRPGLSQNITFGAAFGIAYIYVDSHSNVTSDYNDFYHPAGGSYMSYGTWAAWQGSGPDKHGLSANPQFVSPGSDFRLQPTSPCIDSGEDIGLIRDYQGSNVPIGSAPEIGAFEFDAAQNNNLKLSPPRGLRIIN